jgi:hypothetical protein
MKKFDNVRDIASDVMNLCDYCNGLETKYEILRFKAALYKSMWMGNERYMLQLKLSEQIQSNTITLARDKYMKTLEDMLNEGRLTEEEYNFCNIR